MPVTQPEVTYVYAAKVLRCVDGDTIEVTADRGFSDSSKWSCRIYGADAPEMTRHERPAGEWVAKRVEEWLPVGTEIVIESRKVRQSFSRYLFHIWKDGVSLSAWLLDSGLAWPTDENGKVIGPRDVMALNLPEGIKQQVRELLA